MSVRSGPDWLVRRIITEPGTRVLVPLFTLLAAGMTIASGTAGPVHLVVLVAPLWFALGWAAVNEAGGWAGMAALGVEPRRLRARIVAAQCATAIVALVVAALLAVFGLRVRGTNLDSGGPVQQVPADVVELGATAALMCVLVANRSRGQALVLAGLVPIIDLVADVRRLPGGDVLRGVWPPSAARVLMSGQEGSRVARVLLVVVLLITVAAAGWWVVRLPGPSGTRDRRTRLPDAPAVVKMLSSVVACAVLPLTLTRALPPQARPSFLLDRWQGNGPDQVAEKFFHAVWAQDATTADRLTVGGNFEKALALSPLLRHPSPGASFALVHLGADGRADVAANLRTGAAHVCLRKRVDRWQVIDVEAGPC